MRRTDARTAAAATTGIALIAFAVALLGAARPGLGAAGPAPAVVAERLAAPANTAVEPVLTDTAPPSHDRDVAAAELGAEGGSLAGAPQELLAYSVACGDLRAVEPRDNGREYRLGRLGNACAATWAPDGRLAVLGPIGRPPGSVSALRLIDRGGTAQVLAIPNRSVTGRPAFWGDGTIDVCAVTRRAPYRPAIYRSLGRAEPVLLAEGCFPAISPRGRLAYALAGVADPSDRPGGLQRVRVTDRFGRERFATDLQGSIVDLQWTGDGSRLVAVTVAEGRAEVVAVDPLHGGTRPLRRAPEGALSIYAAPTGSEVAIVQTRSNGSVQVAEVDAGSGNLRWSRPAHGVTRVAWQPGGALALVADEREWRLVEREGGKSVVTLPRLGGEPSWCCTATRARRADAAGS